MSDAKDDRLRDVPMVTRLRAVLNPACKGGRDAERPQKANRRTNALTLNATQLNALHPFIPGPADIAVPQSHQGTLQFVLPTS